MRLINVHTFELARFVDERGLSYAILSHRWQEEEVSFRDMQDLSRAASMKGFAKIKRSCELARARGYDYLWVDTCCIDSDSSAELSEAINSMYRWYESSAVCFVYLSDVDSPTSTSVASTVDEEIQSSLWFTRGWTLQELLAPLQQSFYDSTWRHLGTKESLAPLLSAVTKIDINVFHGGPISSCSIAQRMCWASGRRTTRAEDIAYCLLGIFDVNMPLLYGEGERKAFLRLQEEIIKQSDDQSIFAWPIRRLQQPGLFADSPAAFAYCQSVRTVSNPAYPSCAVTNRGLSATVKATPVIRDTYLVRLDCLNPDLPIEFSSPHTRGPHTMAMFLRRLKEDDQYARVMFQGRTFFQVPELLWSDPATSRDIQVKVRQRMSNEDADLCMSERVQGFRICTPKFFSGSLKDKDLYLESTLYDIDCLEIDSSSSIYKIPSGIRSLAFNGRKMDTSSLSETISIFGGSVTFTLSRKFMHLDLSSYHGVASIMFGFDFWQNPVCLLNPIDFSGFGKAARPKKLSYTGHRLSGLHQKVSLATLMPNKIRLATLQQDLVIRMLPGRLEGSLVWNVYLNVEGRKIE